MYTYDSTTKDKLKRNYFDFVGRRDSPTALHSKHFKISSNLLFWASVQHTQPGKTVSYNCLPSNHGHSDWDGLACHTKQTSETFRAAGEVKVTTLNGIQSYHQFWFGEEHIHAYSLSKFDEVWCAKGPPDKSFSFSWVDYCAIL